MKSREPRRSQQVPQERRERGTGEWGNHGQGSPGSHAKLISEMCFMFSSVTWGLFGCRGFFLYFGLGFLRRRDARVTFSCYRMKIASFPLLLKSYFGSGILPLSHITLYWPQHNPWGPPLVTGFILDIEPLTGHPWTLPSSQFLTPLTANPSNPFLSHWEVRMLGEDRPCRAPGRGHRSLQSTSTVTGWVREFKVQLLRPRAELGIWFLLPLTLSLV